MSSELQLLRSRSALRSCSSFCLMEAKTVAMTFVCHETGFHATQIILSFIHVRQTGLSVMKRASAMDKPAVGKPCRRRRDALSGAHVGRGDVLDAGGLQSLTTYRFGVT